MVLSCTVEGGDVHHQMYIMSKQNPAFDQEDKEEGIAEEFKPAGHIKYLPYKVVQCNLYVYKLFSN